MLNDVAFGQYYPVQSAVHKMDPRAKIVFLIAYIVVIFLVKNFFGFLAAGAFVVLAEAMDARCYSGSKNRTKYKKLTFTYRDLIALFVMGALYAGVILLNIYGVNVI